MKYDRITRLLHLLVAVGVTSQMLTSLVMVYPKPGRLPNQWYEIHESIGVGLLAVVGLYWLWIVARTLGRGEPMMLFPWFSARRLADLWGDLVETGRGILSLRLPGGERSHPLPVAIQGLGLLLALAMAGTGTSLELGMAPDGGLSPLLHDVKEVHEALAPVMWAYLLAHPLLGVLHQMSGHRSLSRMFDLH